LFLEAVRIWESIAPSSECCPAGIQRKPTGLPHLNGFDSLYSKKKDHPVGGLSFWSRIRESKATKHIDIQLLFEFVAEIVAESFLKNCKNQYQNGGMFHTSRHIFHSE